MEHLHQEVTHEDIAQALELAMAGVSLVMMAAFSALSSAVAFGTILS